MALPFVADSLSGLPTSCGCYLFLDEAGRVLYVGKARNIKDRVGTYLLPREARPVNLLLPEHAAAIDWVVTDTESEALVLENALIKRHDPPLNVKLKDDSLHFSLQVVPGEEWPRLRVVRKRKGRAGALHFGPYPSAHGARHLMRELNGIFPLRSCDDHALHNRSRPCIEYEMKRCLAPCMNLCTREEYAHVVTDLLNLLRGQERGLLAGIEERMHAAAAALEFEHAADLRDRLHALRAVLRSAAVSVRGTDDVDALGVACLAGKAACCVLSVRDGVVSGTRHFEAATAAAEEEVLEALLLAHYSEESKPPRRVLLCAPLSGGDAHAERLSALLGSRVNLEVAQRGGPRRLVDLARKNALSRLEGQEQLATRQREILERLRELAKLRHLPRRIEGFDISHLAGESVVGSCVAFLDGRPDPKRYRSFRLRGVQRNDDFAAMEEVLRRRLQRGLKEDDLPDLLLIDGGPPQLARVLPLLKEAAVTGTDVIALAKARAEGPPARAHERIWIADASEALILAADEPALLLLMRVRDEAHRRAIKHNRALRRGRMGGSVLESVPGVGRAKAARLLSAFGSIQEIRRQDVSVLARTPGISAGLARRILDALSVMS
jgi:excinuclease ABC subunit C